MQTVQCRATVGLASGQTQAPSPLPAQLLRSHMLWKLSLLLLGTFMTWLAGTTALEGGECRFFLGGEGERGGCAQAQQLLLGECLSQMMAAAVRSVGGI